MTNIGNLNENRGYLRLFEKMLNILMKDGKKKVARKLLKNALTIASSKVDKSESFIFLESNSNLFTITEEISPTTDLIETPNNKSLNFIRIV